MKLAGIDIPFKNPYYRIGSSYSFLFFISWCGFWAFFAIYLKNNIGLTGAQLGILYSVNQAAAILFQFAYGIVQDKLGLRKHLVWLIGGIIALTAPFLIYIYEPGLKNNFYPTVIAGGIFIGAGYLAGAGLLESFIEKMSRTFQFEFGTARAWGSLGYAIGAAVYGIIFSINPHINFWLTSVGGVLFLIVNCLFDDKKSLNYSTVNTKSIALHDFTNILKDKNFWIFVIYSIGGCFYSIGDQQLFTPFFSGLFETEAQGIRVYGFLNSFQVFLEVVFLLSVPTLIKRIGPKNGLLLATAFMATRMVMPVLTSDPYIISVVKLFHAIETALVIVSAFAYFAANFDKRLSATLYLGGVQIAGSIGTILFSTPIGYVLDLYSYQTAFLIIASVVGATGLFGLFALSNKRNR